MARLDKGEKVQEIMLWCFCRFRLEFLSFSVYAKHSRALLFLLLHVVDCLYLSLSRPNYYDRPLFCSLCPFPALLYLFFSISSYVCLRLFIFLSLHRPANRFA